MDKKFKRFQENKRSPRGRAVLNPHFHYPTVTLKYFFVINLRMPSLQELNKRLAVPAASSSYPTLGASYRRGGYEVDRAGRLAMTGRNYYGSKAGIPEGMRMS